MIADYKQAIAGDGDAAINAARSVPDQAARSGLLKMPHLMTRAGIQRPTFISRRDVHQAIDDDRRSLQTCGVREIEDPLRSHALYVGRIDLRQLAISIPRLIAVIGRPARLRCHGAVTV